METVGTVNVPSIRMDGSVGKIPASSAKKIFVLIISETTRVLINQHKLKIILH